MKGFNIEYLQKVPEVKDTVHKHSLLHHVCTMVLDKYPESTDLYSEMGPVARCAKVNKYYMIQETLLPTKDLFYFSSVHTIFVLSCFFCLASIKLVNLLKMTNRRHMLEFYKNLK